MSFRFRTWIALAALTVAAIIVGSAPGLGGAVVQTGVQPTEPSVASLMARLRFSDIPKDDEFLRTSVFAQPLVPVGSTSPEENKQLAALLVAYDAAVRSGHRDAAEPLLRFLADHPPSAWKPALLVNSVRFTGKRGTSRRGAGPCAGCAERHPNEPTQRDNTGQGRLQHGRFREIAK